MTIIEDWRRLPPHKSSDYRRRGAVLQAWPEAAQTVRAMVRTPTTDAPARVRQRAHSPAVAPVVSTSSTRTTWQPRMVSGVVTANAPRTFRLLAGASRSAWGTVGPRRTSTSAFTGTPQARSRYRDRSRAWL